MRSREPTSVFISLSSTSQLEGEKSQPTPGPLGSSTPNSVCYTVYIPGCGVACTMVLAYYHLLVHT